VIALAKYDYEVYIYICAIVLIFYVHILLMNASWKYNTVGLTGVLLYLCIPISYGMEWLFVRRPVESAELLGTGLIFLTNVTIVSLRLFKIIN